MTPSSLKTKLNQTMHNATFYGIFFFSSILSGIIGCNDPLDASDRSHGSAQSCKGCTNYFPNIMKSDLSFFENFNGPANTVEPSDKWIVGTYDNSWKLGRSTIDTINNPATNPEILGQRVEWMNGPANLNPGAQTLSVINGSVWLDFTLPEGQLDGSKVTALLQYSHSQLCKMAHGDETDLARCDFGVYAVRTFRGSESTTPLALYLSPMGPGSDPISVGGDIPRWFIWEEFRNSATCADVSPDAPECDADPLSMHPCCSCTENPEKRNWMCYEKLPFLSTAIRIQLNRSVNFGIHDPALLDLAKKESVSAQLHELYINAPKSCGNYRCDVHNGENATNCPGDCVCTLTYCSSSDGCRVVDECPPNVPIGSCTEDCTNPKYPWDNGIIIPNQW